MAERRGIAVMCIGCGGELEGDGADRRRCTCEEERGRARPHVETYVLELAPERPERKPN